LTHPTSAGRFRYRYLCNVPDGLGLVRLDASKFDHLAPLLGFGRDELAEVGRRAGKHRAAQVGQPRLDLGLGERAVNFVKFSKVWVFFFFTNRGKPIGDPRRGGLWDPTFR
jgi:hypothetical protein